MIRPNWKKWGHVSVIGFSVLLIVVLIVAVLQRNAAPQSNGTSAAKSFASGTPTEYENPIMDQETLEANLEAKWKSIQEMEASTQAARERLTGPKVVPTRVPERKPKPTEPPETGITWNTGSLQSGYGAYYELNNVWKGFVDGAYTKAIAGAVWDYPHIYMRGIPQQGLVQVWTSRGERLPAIDNYESPYRCGPLEVIREDSARLLLISTSTPSWFEFDLASRTWTKFGVIDDTSGRADYREAVPPCPKQGEVPPMPTDVPWPLPTAPLEAKAP